MNESMDECGKQLAQKTKLKRSMLPFNNSINQLFIHTPVSITISPNLFLILKEKRWLLCNTENLEKQI